MHSPGLDWALKGLFSLTLIQTSARMQESMVSRSEPPINKPLFPSDSNSPKMKY